MKKTTIMIILIIITINFLILFFIKEQFNKITGCGAKEYPKITTTENMPECAIPAPDACNGELMIYNNCTETITIKAKTKELAKEETITKGTAWYSTSYEFDLKKGEFQLEINSQQAKINYEATKKPIKIPKYYYLIGLLIIEVILLVHYWKSEKNKIVKKVNKKPK